MLRKTNPVRKKRSKEKERKREGGREKVGKRKKDRKTGACVRGYREFILAARMRRDRGGCHGCMNMNKYGKWT